MFYKSLYFIAFLATITSVEAQLAKSKAPVPAAVKGIQSAGERILHYQAEGTDFVTVNGKMRFNRALYGTNTGFRIETGDLPEFALYMPGMGGNFKLGLIAGNKSTWITAAKSIKAIYRPGSMMYEVKDPLLGNGSLQITVLALADTEGMIIKTQFVNVSNKVALCWVFGGASGKKFSRDGDIGADPESSFYLQPDYCKDNTYTISKNSFHLLYGTGRVLTEDERYEIQYKPKNELPGEINKKLKQLSAIVPPTSIIKVIDATRQQDPLTLYQSNASATPAIAGKMPVVNGAQYFLIQPADTIQVSYNKLVQTYNEAEAARKKLAGRVKVVTPDPWINTLGGALSVAADGIWESPTYMHGAVAWRMRLPAWRGAYVADALGWHDRARTHFSSYALSQVTTPATGPVVFDTALHLARQLEKMGTSMFSSGYICRNPNGDFRPHHYDMNLVFVDQLLTHFYYTGDTAYIKQQWPLLQRHLAWEKRNFDADNDGLYDAYCCIWASDALQYSGGGVTHSSAYNYRANTVAAQLAPIVGEDPTPYQNEANKIFDAVNNQLWLPELGWYAEYKDALGDRLLHPAAGLWTIYHAIDEKLPDGFKAFQALRYVDKSIPHIPVRAKGLRDTTNYVLTTTNWQPYDWSLNNVVLAENLHTALAYWQGNRSEEAYRLWKSALVESMYLSSSPGGFEQLSYYDAIRGELYRDFADPIGMAGRSLVEGLFGITPDALKDTLAIKPGWPAAWNSAALQTPDIALDFKRTANTDQYILKPAYPHAMNLQLRVRAWKDAIESITVNNQPVRWHGVTDAVGEPVVEITTGKAKQYTIVIKWAGTPLQPMKYDSVYAMGSQLTAATPAGFIQSIFDPQQILQNIMLTSNQVQATVQSAAGNKTAFIQLRQGEMVWWFPLCFEVKQPLEIIANREGDDADLHFYIRNNGAAVAAKIKVNSFEQTRQLPAHATTDVIEVLAASLVPGSNRVQVEWEGNRVDTTILNWQVTANAASRFEKVDLTKYYNDKVTNIFRQSYLSPRPQAPTLQLPTQGIGNWCYPLVQPVIDDAGLRKAAVNNEIMLQQHIPLATPADTLAKNIAFTSKWDNYPDSVVVPLAGNASHAYYLMAGSTNPMQTRLVNGELRVHYKDGTTDTLALVNPQNWWPIEQDYFIDGVGFTTSAARPLRLQLKTGKLYTTAQEYTSLKGFSNMAIDGGAATILDMRLDPNKELQSVSLHTIANDVVIGLMSVTLTR
ncbi:glycogen debranching protein [Niastella yeongjuensis]|uniref:Glycogen debranching protein n=1 Tax=Niastella yeongjuensis TaxID=354355 RepID=A0A1V9F4X7_9BACT|nr:DUF4450 domain-containing protein [Niastella yeongjuensis]OQP53352.1 glycogen debranching protein [Niastella yeongjuensis]SEP14277.1 protein of unknown function [Niastella yeongjuensis]